MRCKQCVWVAMLVLAGTSGCAMCDNVEDWTYAAFGGKWQRDNPTSGRVGSVFDPAGMQVAEGGTPTKAEPELAEPEASEETAEPLLAEPEETPEAAEPQMEPAEEPADEKAVPKPAAGKPAGSDAQADPDPAPAPGGITPGGLGLPPLPAESAASPQPKAGDDGLLPPLDPPPQ